MLIGSCQVREADMVTEEHRAPVAPTGTHDVMPPESSRWQHFVGEFARNAERYGFAMVHTPMFEDVKVFHRGIGEGSDVVGKEMYEFTDRGGRHLALRPEGTASIVRAFVQHRPPVPWRAWYVTPSFRYERPQAGRYRQHHQVGVEALGTDDPDVDVEVISLAAGFLGSLGLRHVTLMVNSMGDQNCRPGYIGRLETHLASRESALCEEHQERWRANPLRVLDCKKLPCIEVTEAGPFLVDHLCEECTAHYQRVLQGLDEVGVSWVANPRLVRGFDYYTKTTFEFASGALAGAQNGVCGGGRYDGLVELLGGPSTSGIGFGIGIERALLACDAEKVFGVDPPVPAAFVVDVTGGLAARSLVASLRAQGLFVERAYDDRSMKAQLKAADRSGAPVALLIGAKELDEKSVTIRKLREEGEQRTVPVADLLAAVIETGEIR